MTVNAIDENYRKGLTFAWLEGDLSATTFLMNQLNVPFYVSVTNAFLMNLALSDALAAFVAAPLFLDYYSLKVRRASEGIVVVDVVIVVLVVVVVLVIVMVDTFVTNVFLVTRIAVRDGVWRGI